MLSNIWLAASYEPSDIAPDVIDGKAFAIAKGIDLAIPLLTTLFATSSVTPLVTIEATALFLIELDNKLPKNDPTEDVATKNGASNVVIAYTEAITSSTPVRSSSFKSFIRLAFACGLTAATVLPNNDLFNAAFSN